MDTQKQHQNGESRSRLAVIIVSWNVCEDLKTCLGSIFENNPGEDYQVIVIDNNSTDGSVQMVQEQFPQVTLIENETNAGFAAANNQGLRYADTEYYLLLNPDTIVPEGAFRMLLDFAEQHPEAGAVGPRQVYPDGTLQYSCRRFPTITAAMFRHTIFGRLFPRAASPQWYLMADWDHAEPREVDWVSGAAMLIRHEALEDVGYLDESFFWGSEDVDYCFRMHKAGWNVMYTPEPVIIHAIGKSTDQVVIPTIIRTHRGMHRLYSKHLATNPLSRALVTVGVWVRAGLLIISHRLRSAWTAIRRMLRPKK
ncbi:MAG: glycosyltransferase family 2 protein [Armatimonadota bacterium]